MRKYQAGGLVFSRTPLLGSQLNPNEILQSYSQPLTNQWDLYKDKEILNLERSRDNMSKIDYYNKIQQQNFDNQLKLQTQERLNKNYDLQNKKFEFEVLKQANDEITTLMEMDKDFVPPALIDYYQGVKKQAGVDDETIANLSPYDLEEITRVISKKRALMYSQKNILNFKYNLKTLDDNLKNAKEYLDRADELAKLGILDAEEHMKYMDAFNQVQRDRILYAQTPVNPTTGTSEMDPFNSEAAKYLSTLPDLIDVTAYKALTELDEQEQNAKIIQMKAQAEKSKSEALRYTFEAQQSKLLNEQANKAVDLYDQWLKQNPNATLDEQSNKLMEMVGPYLDVSGGSGKQMDMDALLAHSLLTNNQDLYNRIMESYKIRNSYTSSKNTTVDYQMDIDSGAGYTVSSDGTKNYGGFIVSKDNIVKQLTINGQTYTNDADFIPKEIKELGVDIITARRNSGEPSAYIKIPATENQEDILNWLKSKFGGYGNKLQKYVLAGKSIKVGDFIYIVSDLVKVTPPANSTGTTSSNWSTTTSTSSVGAPAPANMQRNGAPSYLQ